MQGEGKKIPVKKCLSCKELAKELDISPTTVAKVENPKTMEAVSLSTIKAYSDYFHIPCSTLLGETDIENKDNLNIHKELGLSDSSISTIKSLSPIALAMLNTFVSKGVETEKFLCGLANVTYSILDCLSQNGKNKKDIKYRTIRNEASSLFMKYMHIFNFKDFKKILIQIEEQQFKMEQQFIEQMYEEYTKWWEYFNNSNERQEYEQEHREELEEYNFE